VLPWVVPRSLKVNPRWLLPLSYSAYRVFKLCPLLFAFERDSDIPPRTNPRARMGTAFHAALEFLSSCSPREREEVIAFFRERLLIERREASQNYREVNQIWPGDLREAMEVTLAARLGPDSKLRVRGAHAVESTLRSADGRLLGRPDEVITTAQGPIIVDYKTGNPQRANLPELEDQLHFYAGLWQEVHDQIVRNGVAIFLLDGSRHEVEISQDRISAILLEARGVADTFPSIRDWLAEAKPGVHCATCDYRPWCSAYWESGVPGDSGAGSLDFEGIICAEHAGDSRAFCIRTKDNHRLLVNRSEEPLPPLTMGTKVRVLDAGQHDSVALRFRWTEIWRLE
jgi:CRISPR/Cas system-associated exonuclease Cas4 (RecB family)